MLSSFHLSVNDITGSNNNITSRDDDDDEFQFQHGMSLLPNDKLIHRQSSDAFMELSESELRTLGGTEQIVFLTLFTIITIVSLLGNTMTVGVLFVRKQRFLFKICLFSLAISDLFFTVASGSHYIAKLLNGATVLWHLGWIGCMGVPFFQTTAVLTESMSLMLIALDRFLAVRNKSNEKLLQSKIFCLGVLIGVWLIGCGFSFPSVLSYSLESALITPEGGISQSESTNSYVGSLCLVSGMDESSTYYIFLFIFIFVPIFVSFFWLNAIISTEIWKRKRAPGINNSSQIRSKSTTRKKYDEDADPSTLEMKNTDETNTTSSSMYRAKNSLGELATKPSNSNVVSNHATQHSQHTQRQKRQMRMFKVILILMSVFFICRLPNWIFLLYKLKYSVSGPLNWNLQYVFGFLGILNSMLNPFLYTFLNETIRVSSIVTGECRKIFHSCFCRKRIKSEDSSNYANNQQMFSPNIGGIRRKSDGGIYLGS